MKENSKDGPLESNVKSAGEQRRKALRIIILVALASFAAGLVLCLACGNNEGSTVWKTGASLLGLSVLALGVIVLMLGLTALFRIIGGGN